VSGSTTSAKVERLAIGAFDGIHLGHRALIDRADGVLIIEKGARLTPGKSRCRYVGKPCFFYPIEAIRELDAIQFLQKVRHDFPNLKGLVVGYDFAFGKDRRFNVDHLRHLFDGEVEVVDEVRVDGIPVHSRTIRELLASGAISQANRLLGRCYQIEGRHVPGQGIGSRELVPTINVAVKDYLIPKDGVYLTYTNQIPSLTFVGRRLTLDGSFTIETHLLAPPPANLDPVRICFLDYLRPNRKFATLAQLKAQIQEDIRQAKEFFDALGSPDSLHPPCRCR